MATANEGNSASLGKYGVAFTDTADVFTPPSGMVIIALQFLDAGTIHTLTSVDTDAGTRKYMNTANLAHASADNLEGTNGQIVAPANVFPAGMTIYGRWSSFRRNAAEATKGTVIYLGPKGS
tara:strand:+ start:120 stop:485 length:366 start_codon:yes stop_codon:yes gene_type:complete